VPTVGVVELKEGKIASVHIYWDQAPVLVQVGLLDAEALPVAGAEGVRKLMDPASVPSELLIRRAKEG
jgi:carboxymethylenebutenolidase